MALGLLCLGLALQGALKIQAQKPIPADIPSPPLSKIPVQPNFQYEQFQGTWYALGFAQSTAWNESLSKTALYAVTYHLRDDHGYNVTSAWLSKEGCFHLSDILVPSDQPSQFYFENATHYDGLQNFTIIVVETDYKQFAMVYCYTINSNKVYFEHILYGRTKNFSPAVEKNFRDFAKFLGVPDNYVVFPDRKANCTNYLLTTTQ